MPHEERPAAPGLEPTASTLRRLRVNASGLEGPFFSLASRHLGLPPGAEARRGFKNAPLTSIEGAPPFAVTLLACTAHLDPRGGASAG